MSIFPSVSLTSRKMSSLRDQPFLKIAGVISFCFTSSSEREQERVVTRLEELKELVDVYGRAYAKREALDADLRPSLRRGVLEEAIRGRLVEQRSEEGSAEPLLTQIEQEKKQLLKAGKLKKRDLTSSTIYRGDDGLYYERVGKRITCIQDQIPFDIPSSWRWVRLGQVFNVVMGQSPDGTSVSRDGDGMEFHQGKIAFGNKVIGMSPYVTSSPRKVAPKNSLLLCVRAPVGLVNITDRDICIGRGLCSLKPVIGDVSFYFWLFHPLIPIFESRSSGSTFKAITLKIVENQLFPLPPEGEQERIVERLDKLMAQIDRL